MFIFEFVVVCLQFHAKFWGYTKSSGPNVWTFTNDIYIYLMATQLFQVQAILRRKLFAVCTLNIPQQKPIRTLTSAMALAQGKWVKLDQNGTGPGARSSHAISIVGQKAYVFGG
ncbi:nitrile-specifier protein 5 [Quercus suber]|uniref:Nitrile-specifier protein 5 n=1 Tax=Quercus suber TaxID=58331 RepID=A0AAW0KIL4_QUESU